MTIKLSQASTETIRRMAVMLRKLDVTIDANTLDVLVAVLGMKDSKRMDSDRQITDNAAHVVPSERAGVLIGELARIVEPSGKKSVTAELDRLAALLKEHAQMPLLDLFKPPEPPSIDREAPRLKALVGEAEFPDALSAVVGGKRVKAGDVLILARAMGYNPGAKLTKAKLIEYILTIHQDIRLLNAKKAAMHGRSAA